MDSGKAWVLYMKYPVRNAGLGLAFLYMTVLGFDNITYGYCLQQCVHESVLGALVGVGAVIGVLGSVSFPFLRKSLGLPKTGLIGMWLLVSTLTLCLSSVWLEGSPFKPDYFSSTYNTTLNQGFMKYNLTATINIFCRISTRYSQDQKSKVLQELSRLPHLKASSRPAQVRPSVLPLARS